MTENTVPRVAKSADLKVGQTIERVYTHLSGTTVTYMGVVGKVTPRITLDATGVRLTEATDDGNPHVTLRILADPTPKPLPDWGVLVRAVGGKHDGKRAFVTRNEQLHFTRWVVEGSVVPVGWGEITDWEVIHDPNAPTADPLDETDRRDRIDREGRRIERHGVRHWHGEMTMCPGLCWGYSLADWGAAYGPLRFADEVTA